jgi:hypothetical protein
MADRGVLTVDSAILRRKQYLALALRRVQPGGGSSRAFLMSHTWQDPSVAVGFGLHRLQTPFVIVGAVATALYMPRRMTDDLDLLVLTADRPAFYHELGEAGYARLSALSVGKTSWRAPGGAELDVLESDEPWARAAVGDPDRTTRQPVVRLPYLVLMKLQASCAQDVADLSRMLGQADEATLAQVRAVVHAYRSEDLEDLESLILLGRQELSADES